MFSQVRAAVLYNGKARSTSRILISKLTYCTVVGKWLTISSVIFLPVLLNDNVARFIPSGDEVLSITGRRNLMLGPLSLNPGSLQVLVPSLTIGSLRLFFSYTLSSPRLCLFPSSPTHPSAALKSSLLLSTSLILPIESHSLCEHCLIPSRIRYWASSLPFLMPSTDG
ncbi:hypothetical protein FPV67DRAFT_784141 [Lyophyllum atratum]|nr:hypothetical protein FPV67DRAFT_784141 [Lyophyllum atratum]